MSEITISKKEAFAKEYVLDLNGTQAAKRTGYSAKTAHVQATRMLKDVKVQEYIKIEMNKRSERTEITADMVLTELARIGFSNISNYAEWDDNGVRLKASADLSDEAFRCVSEVSHNFSAEGGGSVKFKLHDKVSALEKMGKHLGMFKDNIHITGVTTPDYASILKQAGIKLREENK